MAGHDERGRWQGGETGDRRGRAAHDALKRAGSRARVAEDLDGAVARRTHGRHADGPIERRESDRAGKVDEQGGGESAADGGPGVGA